MAKMSDIYGVDYSKVVHSVQEVTPDGLMNLTDVHSRRSKPRKQPKLELGVVVEPCGVMIVQQAQLQHGNQTIPLRDYWVKCVREGCNRAGKPFKVSYHQLYHRTENLCGCVPNAKLARTGRRTLDIAGITHGRLTPVEYERAGRGWLCVCVCGQEEWAGKSAAVAAAGNRPCTHNKG